MNSLAIVGHGKGFKNVLISEHEIWTVQSVIEDLGKANKVFRLHEHEKQLSNIENTELVYLNNLPIERLCKIFGNQFYSSIAWMLAYAVFLGYKDIYFYGIDMAVCSEYGYQRDNLNRLIGKCESLNVNINIPEWSMMFIPPTLYGL